MIRARLRYVFDNIMSRGTIALIGWLFILTILLVVSVTFLVVLFGSVPDDAPEAGFFGTAWFILMRAMDPGALSGDHGTWSFLVLMFVTTVGGIFLVSALIGVINSGIETRLGELRKGHSRVIEEDHTVILGWSSAVYSVINELVVANRNRNRPRIAILAEMDKVEMEYEIRSRVTDTGKTRIVCRSGSPIDLKELRIISPHTARSIIILSPEIGNPDAQVIKTVLALTNNPQRRKNPYHIVAEITEQKNLGVAKLVGGNEVQFVMADDLISRIMAQTCRQSGLSIVYDELLDFEGDEIYFQPVPELSGCTFRDAVFAFEDSAVLGLQRKDGEIALKPDFETVLKDGDSIIAISEDDDTVSVSERKETEIQEDAIRDTGHTVSLPERTLMLGWNKRVPKIIRELDSYVEMGSEVLVVTETYPDEDTRSICSSELEHLTIQFRNADTTDRSILDTLDCGSFDHVIILSSSDLLDVQEADARTLITLLHLRDISKQRGESFTIVSEMLDVQNRELAEVTGADDYIVSNKLDSQMLAQVSENRGLTDIFNELFDVRGSEIYLRPAGNYVELSRKMDFYTVLESGLRKGEIAVGYRIASKSTDASEMYGVVLNPVKSAPLTFSPDDRIIVLAGD